MSQPADDSTLVKHSTHIVRERRRVLARGVEQTWEEPPRHPDAPTGSRSLIIQEAVDEFLKLSENDPNLSRDTYCRKFSDLGDSLQSSICRQLEVEQYLHCNARFKKKLETESWPRPGEQRGSFNFIEEIGRGGTSRVFLCTQPALGDRQVVVKVSHASPAEADSLGRLRHRNIVPVLSVEDDRPGGLSMLCMPFLGRSTLHDYLDQLREDRESPSQQLLAASRRWQHPSDRPDISARPEGFEKAVALQQVIAWIGSQVADALAHAHDHGIFHGDVKPSNILITSNGMPMLMDFNLAANLARSRSADGGTLPYMPPEQLRSIVLHNGAAGRYDQQSDIFSLGIVLYEALTGRLPFPLDSNATALGDIATDLLRQQEIGAVPLRTFNSQVSVRLARLVHRCLEYHPQARFENAAKLAAVLKEELGAWSVLKTRCAAHRRKLLAASALLAAVVSVATIATASRPPRHLRLFNEAVTFQDRGDYRHAQQLLEESLRTQPGFTDGQFELGRSLLQQALYEEAKTVFSRLNKVEPSARSAAYIAYCFNLQGKHTLAIPWYEITLQRGGRAPEALNNLAYSYAEGSSALSPRQERRTSKALLTEALHKSPHLSSGKLNYLRLALEQHQEDDLAIPPEVPDICRSLVKECPDCGQASLHAAILFAIMSAEEPAFLDEGFGFLQAAIELGAGPNRQFLERSSRWAPYRDDPRWVALLEKAGRPALRASRAQLDLVVEPLSLARPVRSTP